MDTFRLHPRLFGRKKERPQEVHDMISLVLAEARAIRLVQAEAVLRLLDVVLHRPPLLVGLEDHVRRD